MYGAFFKKCCPQNYHLIALAGIVAKECAKGDNCVEEWENNGGVQQKQMARARAAVRRHMAIVGAPGISVGVSRDGRTIWREGFGLADVESGAPCAGESVMRIASISKPITATLAARLVERGKLDLDKSIHEYLSPDQFPRKTVNGREVQITTRQLLSHLSGVRHYPKEKESDPDSTSPEFFSNKHFDSVSEALTIFKDDPLLCEPGTEFHYTTHGYTLLSAVLEKADGRAFGEMLRELFDKLGMRNTHLDIAKERVVPHRTRYYQRNGQRLENVCEVDCSNKIAGGGIISCVGDLLKFANAMLYRQCGGVANLSKHEIISQLVPKNVHSQTPLLQSSSMCVFWKRHAKGVVDGKWGYDYGLGWTMPRENCWDKDHKGRTDDGQALCERKYWYHLGGAVGVSSALLIRPNGAIFTENEGQRGICVVVLANCQNCPCLSLAEELASIFGDE